MVLIDHPICSSPVPPFLVCFKGFGNFGNFGNGFLIRVSPRKSAVVIYVFNP